MSWKDSDENNVRKLEIARQALALRDRVRPLLDRLEREISGLSLDHNSLVKQALAHKPLSHFEMLEGAIKDVERVIR